MIRGRSGQQQQEQRPVYRSNSGPVPPGISGSTPRRAMSMSSAPNRAAAADAFYAAFLENLRTDLVLNSKPVIHSLTQIAGENKAFARAIVDALRSHVMECRKQHKLCALYLCDSIVKNVGEPFLDLFARDLPAMYLTVWENAPESRNALGRLLDTWDGPPGSPSLFPPKMLEHIHNQIRERLDRSTGTLHSPEAPRDPRSSRMDSHMVGNNGSAAPMRRRMDAERMDAGMPLGRPRMDADRVIDGGQGGMMGGGSGPAAGSRGQVFPMNGGMSRDPRLRMDAGNEVPMGRGNGNGGGGGFIRDEPSWGNSGNGMGAPIDPRGARGVQPQQFNGVNVAGNMMQGGPGPGGPPLNNNLMVPPGPPEFNPQQQQMISGPSGMMQQPQQQPAPMGRGGMMMRNGQLMQAGLMQASMQQQPSQANQLGPMMPRPQDPMQPMQQPPMQGTMPPASGPMGMLQQPAGAGRFPLANPVMQQPALQLQPQPQQPSPTLAPPGAAKVDTAALLNSLMSAGIISSNAASGPLGAALAALPAKPSSPNPGMDQQQPPAPRPTSFSDPKFQELSTASVAALMDSSERIRPKLLDFKFQRKKRLRSNHAASRAWFVPGDMWVAGTAPGNSSAAPSAFFNSEDPEESQPAPEVISIAADDNQKTCAISGEKFEEFFDEGKQEWRYLNARRLTGAEATKYGVEENAIVLVSCLSTAMPVLDSLLPKPLGGNILIANDDDPGLGAVQPTEDEGDIKDPALKKARID